MSDLPVCWKCGSPLQEVPLPLGRRSDCPICHAELHVCRMCRHYDTAKAKHCREPVAEPVQDKTRANFCDWFQHQDHAFHPGTDDSENKRASLDDLFGVSSISSPKTSDAAKKALDDLFGGK